MNKPLQFLIVLRQKKLPQKLRINSLVHVNYHQMLYRLNPLHVIVFQQLGL